MPFFALDKAEMVADGLQMLRDYSNVTQLSPGSKTRLLLDFMTEEQHAQHALFDENIAQTYIRWAEGRFLDYFGDMLNIPRLPAEVAVSNPEDVNFTFYVDGGTFGDINTQLDFVIPAGTLITTPEFPTEKPLYAEDEYRPRQEKIEYDLVSDLTCPANQSFVYGRIRARVEGAVSNVPRNVLTSHDFTGYVASAQSRLQCTNKYAIASGRTREGDEAYRYRLMNAFKARERANKIAIRLAALSVPGVADIEEINAEQGPGTFSLYVRSVTPTTSPVMLDRVREVVQRVAAFGVRAFVLAPVPIGLEFVIAVNWKSGVTSSEQARGYAAIREFLEDTLNQTEIGEAINLADLASSVAESDPSIQAIGLENPGLFEEVYAYRQSADGEGTKKTLVTSTELTPLYNERIILETGTKYRGVRFL